MTVKMDEIAHELRNQGCNVAPDRSPEEARHQWVLQWRSLFEKFADLALRLVEDFAEWRMIFVERDACPIEHLVRVEADHLGVVPDSVKLPFNRQMLPRDLRAQLERVESNSSAFAVRRDLIESYLASHHSDSLPVHDLVVQAAGTATRVVVVDTGYWGTVPLYVRTLLSHRAPSVEVEWRQVFGPPGSPCEEEDDPGSEGEEGNTLIVEMLSHPYELETMLLRDKATGIVSASRPRVVHKEMHYKGELQALEELLEERRSGRCR